MGLYRARTRSVIPARKLRRLATATLEFFRGKLQKLWNSPGLESKIVEFFRGKTLIFKEFFRGEQRFHGSFREKSTFSRISSGVAPFLRKYLRSECNLVEFFRGKKKRLVLNRGGGGCGY